MKILVVDDEQVALSTIKRLLKRRGFRKVEVCSDGREAIRAIKQKDFDIVLLDLLMPDTDGFKVLETAKPYKPHTEFIILTAVDEISTAVKTVRLGAYDYLIKPVDNERLFLSIERAYERRGLLAGLAGSCTGKCLSAAPAAFSHIITQSPRMIELLSYAQIMAGSGNPIMITGESGTGKELLAKGIHQVSMFSKGPFVAVNATSIPDSLFEGQVFGHVKGAFTGSDTDHAGFFEQADGGTLFLDEIGELPLHLQPKLLRVLEERTVVRVGATKPIPLNVGIVSATNRNMDKALQEGRFRLDLMCRLKSAHIHLPPLSEREGDIALLADYFLKRACARYKKKLKGFSPEAMEVLNHKEFPGNIRSLAQFVENAVLIAESDLILPHHLSNEHAQVNSFSRTLCTLKEDQEKHFAYVLNHVKGDRKQAAEILGLSLRQVQRKLAQIKKESRLKSLVREM